MLPQAHQLSLRLLQRCPSCQAALPADGIRVFAETDESLFAHLTCQTCMHNFLTYIVNNNQGLIGNAMLTDMNYQETLATLSRSHLTEDDVIAIYQLISQSRLLADINLETNQQT